MEETSATGCVGLAVVLSTHGQNKCNLSWKWTTAWGCLIHVTALGNQTTRNNKDFAEEVLQTCASCNPQLCYEMGLQRDPSLPILSWILKLVPAWTGFPLYVLEPFPLTVISPLLGERGSKSPADLWPSVSQGQLDTLKPLWSPRKHGRVIYWVL